MEHCFKDKYLFYRFTISGDENRIAQRNGSKTEKNTCLESVKNIFLSKTNLVYKA